MVYLILAPHRRLYVRVAEPVNTDALAAERRLERQLRPICRRLQLSHAALVAIAADLTNDECEIVTADKWNHACQRVNALQLVVAA